MPRFRDGDTQVSGFPLQHGQRGFDIVDAVRPGVCPRGDVRQPFPKSVFPGLLDDVGGDF